MRLWKISVIFLLLILTIGAASASEDASENITAGSNDDSMEIANGDIDNILEITQEDTTGEASHNYTELAEDIASSQGTFDIEYNYTFDENDTPNSVTLEGKHDFVINGNYHTLDASNRTASLLILNSTNVTINNLIFINANGLGALYIANSSVTLNNVSFIDNVAGNYAGALYVDKNSFVTVNNSRFRDNIAGDRSGSDVFVQTSELQCLNCEFTSRHSTKYGSIFTMAAHAIILDNCTFANISATYSPAMFCWSQQSITYALINNTRFINLSASETAGAVSFKMSRNAIIENCIFENTHSAKNAGAVFVDTVGEGAGIGDVSIINMTCTDTYSSFGGAIVHIGGNLTIMDSTFTGCHGDYEGGALYVSWASVQIKNTTFASNHVENNGSYPSSGGAIYFDHGELNMTDCEFSANNALSAGAICLYDSIYHIDNVTLNGNGNQAVLTFFDSPGSKIGTIYGTDNISSQDLNNTFYPGCIIGEGKGIILVTNDINLTNLPYRFDLRDYGWVTDVRDQGLMGSCWAFGMTAALESALLKATGIAYDLSEDNMQNLMLKYSKYGDIISPEGGFTSEGAAYALNWFGVFPADFDTYDELGKFSPVISSGENIHVQDMIYVPIDTTIAGGDPTVKEAILKYGAVAILYFAGQISADGTRIYYNDTTFAQYDPDGDDGNHIVAIVGWDDSYPSENFAIDPGHDGAWIIKNSWGNQSRDEGYFYLSYSDTTINSKMVLTTPVAFIFENTLPYNKNYQYDLGAIYDFIHYEKDNPLYGTPITYVNDFISFGDDLIAAVGTYFNQSGVDYTVSIMVNDIEVLTQNGTSPYYGYHTIKLDKYIPVKDGDDFSVYITSNAVPISANSRVHYLSNISRVYFDETWQDLVTLYPNTPEVACIKAYTLMDDTLVTQNTNITVDYGSESYFSVKVVTADGHAVGEGAIVNFTINGKTTAVSTDADGIAKLAITDVPGTYEVTTAYKNQTYKNTVVVKLNPSTCKITENKNIKVDYDSGKYFSVKIVSADGKVASSGVSVKFTINGKTKTVQTDANGIAKIKITDVPKKYTMTTTYNGKSVKNTITVKQVLKAKKVALKRTAKKFTLKATLKINGKLQKGKIIKFKFNGKTYKVKTNKKGVAQKTLNKKVINKLKKGKTYTVKVTYLKDTIKTTVKVK